MADEARASAASEGFVGPLASVRRETGTLLAIVRGFPAPIGLIDLVVHTGDVVHLRGGNGSGKTSLLRALAGLDAPLRPAQVEVLGSDPHGLAAPELARRVRAIWSSARSGLVGLTVAGEARLRGHALPPRLASLAGRDVAELSTGEASRVALETAASSAAPLLLLDEPCAALDADGRALLHDLVRAAGTHGAVVIVDPSGWGASVATRTVDLSPASPAGDQVLPFPGPSAPIVSAPAKVVRRGPVGVALPSVLLPAGFHAVTGRNGSGKSALLARLSGLHGSDGVTVGAGPPRPGRTTRLLQPDAGELLTAGTVREELAGVSDPEGLVPAGILDRHPLSLSAGEAHRVALAKALGVAAPLHLLDEPDAHLDADGRLRLMAAIARRLAEGSCVVAATHDAGLVAAAHSRVEVGA